MKFIGITLCLILSFTTLAQTSQDLDKEREEHIQKLKDYQEKNPGWDSAPSDEYVSFFKKWNDESLAITLRYHKKHCEEDSSQCLSSKQQRDLASQYKIASEAIERQNRQAKTAKGDLVTKPGDFGGNRAPAEDEKTPPVSEPKKEEGKDTSTLSGPSADAPKVDAPKVDAPKDDAPKVDAPKVDAPKVDAPEVDAPKPDAPKVDAPKADAPEVDAPKIDAPEIDTPETDSPKEDVLLDQKAEEKKDEAEIEEELDKFNDEEFPKNYDPKTCEWVEDMPRKIVYGPTYCSKQAAQICTGYVVCERKQGGGKFVRMSSCSPKNCGRSKEDAIACTLEQSFYSRRPEDERNHFVSPELKKFLTAPKVRAQ
ncbi:MAG TPA: hypothetical protein VKZ84_02515 [Bacteriovoracaceae bacterium]|nr:hypothetical protein [Bacteriovoracaceae bacterium]